MVRQPEYMMYAIVCMILHNFFFVAENSEGWVLVRCPSAGMIQAPGHIRCWASVCLTSVTSRWWKSPMTLGTFTSWPTLAVRSGSQRSSSAICMWGSWNGVHSDCPTGLRYSHFKKHYSMVKIELMKKMQQITCRCWAVLWKCVYSFDETFLFLTIKKHLGVMSKHNCLSIGYFHLWSICSLSVYCTKM